MISSQTILPAIGRGILGLCFIFLGTAFSYNDDFLSSVASATGAVLAFIPVGKIPSYTLKLKVSLLLLSFIFAVALQSEPKVPAKQVGLIAIFELHA